MNTRLASIRTHFLRRSVIITSCFVMLFSCSQACGTLESSTFLGAGSWGDDEGIAGIAIGLSNKVYVVGWVESSAGFPTVPGCYQTTFGGGTYDVFVSRFDPELTTLEASTYLGGSDRDIGRAIAIDAAGNVYVVGDTASTNFPVSSGAFTNGLNDLSTDAFVCKLDPNLTNLLASTFLGGSHVDGAYAVALTPSNVYVSGVSYYRNDFPTTSAAFSTTNAGDSDAFVTCFDTNLSTLVASTLIGGHYDEYCTSIAVDQDGNIFIAGHSESAPNLYPPTFPTTLGAYDTSWHNGSGAPLWQGFVCKFAADASLEASTLIGGYYEEEINGLVLDEDGSVYVAGYTGSSDFPTTPTAFATNSQSAKEAVVCRFDNSLSNLLASTYLGGSSDDKALAISISPIGVAVTGYTWAEDFPTTPGAYQPEREGYYEDVFVSRFDRNLSVLRASTYIGSSKYDRGYALAFGNEAMPSLYLGGYSNYYFPTTPGAYDVSYGSSSGYEGVVCRFDALFTRIDDADFDGIPDWWETLCTGITTGLLASADLDLDGMTALEEFIAGTDPAIKSSVFRMEPIVTTPTDEISMEFDSVDGRLYTIESTDTLGEGDWNTLADDVPGTGETKMIIDTSTAPSRCYRAEVSLPGY